MVWYGKYNIYLFYYIVVYIWRLYVLPSSQNVSISSLSYFVSSFYFISKGQEFYLPLKFTELTFQVIENSWDLMQ